MKEKLELLKTQVSFEMDYLHEHLNKKDNEEYYNSGIGNALIELIIRLLILEEHEKLKSWCSKTVKYYNELTVGNYINDAEQAQVILYRYIISLLTNSDGSDYITRYIDSSKRYYAEHFTMNEHSIAMYEELVVYLVISGDYRQAKEYTKQLVMIKKGSLAEVIDRYLDIRESNEPLHNLAKECKKILNKRRTELTRFLTSGFPYFLFYYRELLKSDSLVEPAQALVPGLN